MTKGWEMPCHICTGLRENMGSLSWSVELCVDPQMMIGSDDVSCAGCNLFWFLFLYILWWEKGGF